MASDTRNTWNLGLTLLLIAPFVGLAIVLIDMPLWVEIVAVVAILALVAVGTTLMRKKGGWQPSKTLPRNVPTMTADQTDNAVIHDSLTQILIDITGVEQPAAPPDYLRMVSGAATVDAEAGLLLHRAVAAARAAGATWQSIGLTLGMTKQAAQKRFATPATPTPQPLDPNERTLGPTATFDEMQELALAGRYGWHSVAVGANFHRMVHSETQWEHTRVTMSPSTVRRLRAEGWQVIDSGFPYAYLKRDTGLTALTEPSA